MTHVLNVATGIEIDRGDSGVVEERVELLDIPEQCILKSETDVKLDLVMSNLKQYGSYHVFIRFESMFRALEQMGKTRIYSSCSLQCRGKFYDFDCNTCIETNS